MKESPPEFLGSAKLVVSRLKATFPERDAEIIVRRLMEWASGWSWHQVLAHPRAPFPPEFAEKLEEGVQRILKNEPLQYILGSEWFLGNSFKVTPAVLIPRPETEELADWICKDMQGGSSPTILDIGTGSGCIAISVALYIRSAKVTALDKSAEALAIARENASNLGASVEFRELDIFQAKSDTFSGLHTIVSNPPYVPEQEMDEMQLSVRDFEPSMALFVPDNEPLVFYRRIMELGRDWLMPGGKLYFEIHRDQSQAVLSLGQSLGYEEGILRKDLQGNDRMIRFSQPI